MKHLRLNGGILVVSYEGMRIDERLLQAQKWLYVILDEAQRIKNWKS